MNQRGLAPRNPKGEVGFTLVELMVSIGILTILLTTVSINLIRPQSSENVSAVADQLLSDLRAQQSRAMSGGSGGSEQGVSFEPNAYTLFSDADSFEITLNSGVLLSGATQIVFAGGSGKTTAASITIQDASGVLSKTININRYGVADIN